LKHLTLQMKKRMIPTMMPFPLVRCRFVYSSAEFSFFHSDFRNTLSQWTCNRPFSFKWYVTSIEQAPKSPWDSKTLHLTVTPQWLILSFMCICLLVTVPYWHM
jgi:hypothetical protein